MNAYKSAGRPVCSRASAAVPEPVIQSNIFQAYSTMKYTLAALLVGIALRFPQVAAAQDHPAAVNGRAPIEDAADDADSSSPRLEAHTGNPLFRRSRFPHDRTITAIGVSFSKPSLNDGYVVDAPWRGIYYRNHHMEITASGGSASRTRLNGEVESRPASYFGIGAHFESGYRWGNRRYGVRGMLLQPHIGMGLGVYSSRGTSKWGPYINPGFNIELPYVLADFSLGMSYNFGSKDTDPAGIRGFHIAPTLNIALDALWDVLDPELAFQGVRTGTVSSVQDRTVFSESGTNSRGQSYTINYTRPTIVTTSFQYEAYTNEIPKLSGIFARYSYNGAKTYRDASSMFGLGYGLRKKMLVLDIYAEYGKLSSVSALSEKLEKNAEDKPSYAPDKDDPGTFRSTATAYRGMIKLGFNVLGLLYNEDENSFSRWVLGVMGGYQGFTGIKAASETFDRDLNRYYSLHPNAERGAYYDARLSEGGIAWGFFAGLEIGNVSLHWEWPKSGAAPLFTSTNFSVQYLLPIKLIRKKLVD